MIKKLDIKKFIVSYPGNQKLLLILLLALILRIMGVWYGLPNFHFHTDENFIIGNLQKMKETGVYVPDNIIYPSTIYYLLLIISWIFKLRDSAYIILFGRLANAISGTIGIYVIYLVTQKLFNRKVALWAAIFLAINFLHVVQSHYLKVDVMGTTLGLVSFLFAIKVMDNPARKNYIQAGIFSGLAFGTQYIQLFWLIPFFLSHFLSRKISSTKEIFKIIDLNWLSFCFSFLITFSITNPFFFLKLENLWRSIEIFKGSERSAIVLSSTGNIPTVIWYFLFLLTVGLYYPIFLLFTIGIIKLIKNFNRKVLILFSHSFVYFGFFSLFQLRTDRLMIPLMPFTAICSAVGILYLKNILFKKRMILLKRIFFYGFFLCLPLIRVVSFDYLISLKDTRQLAAEYIESNYPKNRTIFAIADTIHIGQYLQKKGFENIMNLFPFETKEVFLYPGEILLIDSSTFNVARNYQNDRNYKAALNNYQLLKDKGTLIKEFQQLLFHNQFFSPFFLEHSSTVNAYHNPTVEIYKIPKIDQYANSAVKFEYMPGKMIHNMELLEIDDKEYVYKNLKNDGIIVGPYSLFPKGFYTLEYYIAKPQCSSEKASVTICVAFAGQGKCFVQRQFLCNDLANNKVLSLEFSLESANRLELILKAGERVSFFVEKALVSRTGYE